MALCKFAVIYNYSFLDQFKTDAILSAVLYLALKTKTKNKTLNTVMRKYVCTQFCQLLKNYQHDIFYSAGTDFFMFYFSSGFQCGFKTWQSISDATTCFFLSCGLKRLETECFDIKINK